MRAMGAGDEHPHLPPPQRAREGLALGEGPAPNCTEHTDPRRRLRAPPSRCWGHGGHPESLPKGLPGAGRLQASGPEAELRAGTRGSGHAGRRGLRKRSGVPLMPFGWL